MHFLLCICWILFLRGLCVWYLWMRVLDRLLYNYFSETLIFAKLITSFKSIYLPSQQTADQPATNADQFLLLCQVWLDKNYPLLLKSVYIPDQPQLCSRWIPDAPTYVSNPSPPDLPRPSGMLIPALHNQLATYSRYKYAHYAKKTNPRSVCSMSTPGLK